MDEGEGSEWNMHTRVQNTKGSIKWKAIIMDVCTNDGKAIRHAPCRLLSFPAKNPVRSRRRRQHPSIERVSRGIKKTTSTTTMLKNIQRRRRRRRREAKSIQIMSIKKSQEEEEEEEEEIAVESTTTALVSIPPLSYRQEADNSPTTRLCRSTEQS